MLKDLKILNGNLELEFNEYTYEYTITVDEDIKELNINYTLEEDCYIKIIGNKLDEEENIIYLEVYNLDESKTYTLSVYKEASSEVSGIENYLNSLEVTNLEEVSLYKVQILTVSIFLVIIILFCLIFKRKKN